MAASAVPQLHGILIGLLILFIVIAFWCVENWISPVPAMIKLILAIVILILIVLWAFQMFGGGGL